MNTIHFIGTVVYFGLLVLLSAYGVHRWLLISLYYRRRKDRISPPATFDPLPKLTVQLPLYNEMYVAERLLDAVVAMDYPADKFEIQVLDDSTDETTVIVARKVKALRALGHDVHHIHRTNREGYKAGALQNGLRTATGEFIAIFDADFVPQSDLLKRTIHYFTDTGIGMIQTRWGHLNDRYSLLTRVQSIFLDGHFLIEQTARSRSGRFFNFNGTAGLWRRDCIEKSGGWHHDTLAEDLDLSYRAQIAGWKFLFLPDIVVPAELPVEMNAFKIQQHRWTKGSIQTCKKMLPVLWRSPLPWKIKLEGVIHLTSNFAYLGLLVLCCLFRGPATESTNYATGGNWVTKTLLIDLPLFLSASVSVMVFYLCAQKELHAHWWKRLACVPLMMGIGVGLSVNNARGVLEAILNHQSEFVRTPKYGVTTRHNTNNFGYRNICGLIPYVELVFAAWFSWLVAQFIYAGQWTTLPFLIIMQGGFLYVGLMSLGQRAFSRVFRPASELAPA